MGEGTRESLRDYYREHIRKLIEHDPEALIELFVDQHLALESLSKTSQKQQSIIELLERKIQELGQRLNEDSHNSHKPPSSDNPYTKPENKTKSVRKKSGKKPGGQKGHRGYRLQPTESPDHMVLLKPKGTCECGRVHKPDFPADVKAKLQYGSTLKSLTGWK